MIAANFVGCGCVYRREVFVKTTGYVPLPVAYGMEEVDLSIRLHAMGSKIVHEPRLRVVHDLKHDHRETETVSAAMVANLALLAYLRYPAVLWPLGLWQCLRKAMELLVKGRVKGVLAGLCDIPGHLWHHRGHRKPLKPSVVLSHIRLRRQSPPIQALE